MYDLTRLRQYFVDMTKAASATPHHPHSMPINTKLDEGREWKRQKNAPTMLVVLAHPYGILAVSAAPRVQSLVIACREDMIGSWFVIGYRP